MARNNKNTYIYKTQQDSIRRANERRNQQINMIMIKLIQLKKIQLTYSKKSLKEKKL